MDILTYGLLNKKVEEAKNVSGEKITEAVNTYLDKNPPTTGATAEQAAQIDKNVADIDELKGDLVDLEGIAILNDLYDYNYKRVFTTSELVNGTYSGAELTTDELNRVRTKEVITLKKGEKLSASVGRDFDFYFARFSGTGFDLLTEWVKSAEYVAPYDEQIIFVSRKSDNSNFANTDLIFDMKISVINECLKRKVDKNTLILEQSSIDSCGNKHSVIVDCLKFENGDVIDVTKLAENKEWFWHTNQDLVWKETSKRLSLTKFIIPTGTLVKAECSDAYSVYIGKRNEEIKKIEVVNAGGWVTNAEYVATEKCEIVIVAKKNDNGDISKENFDGNFFIQTKPKKENSNEIAEYYVDEMADTIASVRNVLTEPCLVFPLFTDSHYKVSAEKPDSIFDCIKNIKHFTERVKCDFISNLGDNTEGDTDQNTTLSRCDSINEKMLTINVPYHQCIGNHDDNRYNSAFDLGQIYRAYISNTKNVYFDNTMNGTNYYRDFDDLKIRCIWLNAQNNGSYGYSNETVTWFTSEALNTPNNYNIIVFTHIDPIASHNYNNKSIANSTSIDNAIKSYETDTKHVIALFSGHNHYDNAWSEPYLSITTNCQKFENENGDPNLWADGSIKPTRTVGTATEDCWDVVIVRPISKKINMVRFGAGEDRAFTY